MDYIEYHFTVIPKHPYTDILVAQLAETGFESFCETDNGVQAYIPHDLFHEAILKNIDILNKYDNCTISYEHKIIPKQKWNALWESNFEPIKVGMECMIRAPFHDKLPGFKFDIIIEPKMSFGTGHHDTTMLMIEEILKTKITNKRVLDMGCGTGLLAILAAKMNAEKIVAIDNEEWAYKNTIENCQINHCQQILAIYGEANVIRNNSFDIIFANINKNVLLADMVHYISHLSTDGLLIMSGFFVNDINEINKKALQLGMKLLSETEKNTWACITFKK